MAAPLPLSPLETSFEKMRLILDGERAEVASTVPHPDLESRRKQRGIKASELRKSDPILCRLPKEPFYPLTLEDAPLISFKAVTIALGIPPIPRDHPPISESFALMIFDMGYYQPDPDREDIVCVNNGEIRHLTREGLRLDYTRRSVTIESLGCVDPSTKSTERDTCAFEMCRSFTSFVRQTAQECNPFLKTFHEGTDDFLPIVVQNMVLDYLGVCHKGTFPTKPIL